ncbi:MAG: chorismate-binding protein [Candidatus Thermoplasmatota archaeon]|nr:chorismate-binding protein [Candidatus Thermoplasmatota archaeon]
MENISVISKRSDILLDILPYFRANNLFSSCFGAPDEILLHSGGPISDLSEQSMLMGPANLRFIVKQQKEHLVQTIKSPLEGEIQLQPKLSPLEIQIEEWIDGWKAIDSIHGQNFADALRQLETYLPKTSGKGFQPGGLTGLLTYDMVQFTEPLVLENMPEKGSILMILYRSDRWIIHNRRDSSIEVCSSIEGDDWAAKARQLISEGIPSREQPPEPKCRIPTSESDFEHVEKVRKTQAAIREGVLYQLNYGRIWAAETDNPWHVFLRLNRDNPAPLSAWLYSPDLKMSIASSSPELLLKQNGSIVSTRPIKGTRPRGDDVEHDANLRGELVGSQKEISEHLMLVDLERNDLGRICKPGSVEWKRWRIEAYPHVQHMVSEIQGELCDEMDGFDALQSIFPGGSITGCPKTATVAAIDQLEGKSRRAWTGSIGLIDPRTSYSQWNILIRTMEAHFREGSWKATVQAGGGLVIGSDPLNEVEEAKWKAQAICKAAWGFSPAAKTIHSPHGSNSVSIHPIPPITSSIQRLIENQDTGLVKKSRINTPEPIRWHPTLILPNPTIPRIIFIDNLDSFSWNIIHAFSMQGAEVVVVPGRDDSITPKILLENLHPTHIVLGPGPGRPEMSKLTMNFAHLAIAGESPPLLGICLGHQALGHALGWPLIPSPLGAVHGVPDRIGMNASSSIMTRYHSLILNPSETEISESQFKITALDTASESLIMGIEHENLPIIGVQYHPESAGSINGSSVLKDFLAL